MTMQTGRADGIDWRSYVSPIEASALLNLSSKQVPSIRKYHLSSDDIRLLNTRTALAAAISLMLAEDKDPSEYELSLGDQPRFRFDFANNRENPRTKELETEEDIERDEGSFVHSTQGLWRMGSENKHVSHVSAHTQLSDGRTVLYEWRITALGHIVSEQATLIDEGVRTPLDGWEKKGSLYVRQHCLYGRQNYNMTWEDDHVRITRDGSLWCRQFLRPGSLDLKFQLGRRSRVLEVAFSEMQIPTSILTETDDEMVNFGFSCSFEGQ
jgi:hypothetical protein